MQLTEFGPLQKAIQEMKLTDPITNTKTTDWMLVSIAGLIGLGIGFFAGYYLITDSKNTRNSSSNLRQG